MCLHGSVAIIIVINLKQRAKRDYDDGLSLIVKWGSSDEFCYTYKNSMFGIGYCILSKIV